MQVRLMPEYRHSVSLFTGYQNCAHNIIISKCAFPIGLKTKERYSPSPISANVAGEI